MEISVLFKTILEQSYNFMTVANMQIHKYIYLHIENNWLAVDMDLPIVKVLKIDFAQLTENG